MDKAPPNDTYLDCVNTSLFVCADTWGHDARVACTKPVKQRIPEQITCIVERLVLPPSLSLSLSFLLMLN